MKTKYVKIKLFNIEIPYTCYERYGDFWCIPIFIFKRLVVWEHGDGY